MTTKQKILKKVYPAFIKLTKFFGMQNNVLLNDKQVEPKIPFHHLSVILNDGTQFGFSGLKGKKVLLVNTASDCGYTAQYAELQQLHENNMGKLEIIAFPSNDFKEQEKATDLEIAQFCKINYGINFPLTKKSSVLKGLGQDRIFKWLTDKDENGWLSQEPSWNFAKYLVDEEGVLTHYFDPSVLPLGNEIAEAINRE